MRTISEGEKLLIAADCRIEEMFVVTLKNKLGVKTDVFYIDSTGKKRIQKIKRHISYLLTAVKSFVYRSNYKYIVFWQQFIGFYYDIIARLWFSKRRYPVSLVLPLIYKKRTGVSGRVYNFLFRFLLSAGALKWFVCLLTKEREFYISEFGEDKYKICFVRYGVNMPGNNQIAKLNGKNRFFFSGGTSNRDYCTLTGAFKVLEENLKIACFPADVKGLDIPSNVELLYNVFRNDFLDYMKKAYAVIITLDDPCISSGQLVLLNAMRLGKAIIVTKISGIEDYVDNNCVILVEPHSLMAIRNAVNYLVNNSDNLSLLASNARRKYEMNFTIEKFAERVAAILKGNICRN